MERLARETTKEGSSATVPPSLPNLFPLSIHVIDMSLEQNMIHYIP